ncbi:TIR-only protein-like [Telopea speciosissima]|uniref:TIR-only protein-like n=1 Tax=Telopea speciosissima TaxID=54955 RepID=UPI001CC7411F|nr:TIR-only protein-like [Telopea speciosissima]
MYTIVTSTSNSIPFTNLVLKKKKCNSSRSQTISPFSRIAARRSSLPPFDVFICHRGVDTKRNFCGLLYQDLVEQKVIPFLDCKSMKPGEELNEAIETALRDCKVGVTIFSPNFCNSENSLHELASMMEYQKMVIPIFYDVNTSDLVLANDGSFPTKQLHRFGWALEMAKRRVGISFDSCKGDWSDLLKKVSNRVVEILKELEDEEKNSAAI